LAASSAISPAPSSITTLHFKSSKTFRASSKAMKLIETALDPMPVSLRTRLVTAKARLIQPRQLAPHYGGLLRALEGLFDLSRDLRLAHYH
jgi:hypothetical protein